MANRSIFTFSTVALIALITLCAAGLARAESPNGPSTAPVVQPTLSPGEQAVAPTLITLRMDDVAIDDVLIELSKQSGYTLRPFNQAMWKARGNHQKISVNYQHQSFWSVMIDFCQKAQISPYFDGSPGRQMLFMPAAQMGPSIINCPASDGGALLMLMTQLSRQRTITFGKGGAPGNDFEGQMTILFEPKVRASALAYQPVIEEAVDDLGNSLLPTPPNTQQGMNPLNRQLQANLSIPLSYPAKVGTKIAHLRGKLKLATAIKTETLEFPITIGDKEQTQQFAHGPHITLQSVKPMDNPNGVDAIMRQYLVQLTVTRDSYDQQKFYELTNGLNVRVTDNQNRELQFQGTRESTNNGTEAKMTLMYYRRGPDEGTEEVGEPAKLAWDLTTESQDVTVPFEFRDLLIP